MSAQGLEARPVERLSAWPLIVRGESVEVPLIELGSACLRDNHEPTGSGVFAHAGYAADDRACLALIRGRRMMSADAWKLRLNEASNLDLTKLQWRNLLAYTHFRGAWVNLTALTVFGEGSHRTDDQLVVGMAVHACGRMSRA